MNPAELAANLFRSTQTEERIRTKDIDTKSGANTEHHHVGRQIRALIAEGEGIMPEDQPTPSESIQQIKKKEAKRLEQQQRQNQPLLFDPENVSSDE